MLPPFDPHTPDYPFSMPPSSSTLARHRDLDRPSQLRSLATAATKKDLTDRIAQNTGEHQLLIKRTVQQFFDENRARFPQRHVSQMYNRIRRRRGHASAIRAVARHLAEATYWMLTKQELYHERGIAEVSPQGV